MNSCQGSFLCNAITMFFFQKCLINFFSNISHLNAIFIFFARTLSYFIMSYFHAITIIGHNCHTIHIKIGAIMNRNNLSVEIKSKIISMRSYTSLTFEEIAAQCGCSVS